MPEADVESLDPQLLAILRCPKCCSALTPVNGELVCGGSGCGLIYRIDRGIPVLLVSEARAPSRASSHAAEP